jgi:copper(I)-binding protein
MKAWCLASLMLSLGACGGEPVPLSASDVTVLEPIPGQDRTVAYLTLDNDGDLPITVNRVTSPQFRTVEMHATIVDDGVAGMQSLDSITIAEGSSIAFEACGRHLMLIEPRDLFEAGDSITLEFHHDQPGLLILSAPMRSRMQGGN